MTTEGSGNCGSHRRMWFLTYIVLAVFLPIFAFTLQGCGGGHGDSSSSSTNTTTTMAAFHHPSMNLLQWNPHWQCMNDRTCSENVWKSAATRLQENSVDFANFVEISVDWVPPSPWKQIQKQCGQDVVALVYESTKWTAVDSKEASANGCIEANDRPYIVQQFNGLNGVKIVVVGAHYGHCLSIGSLGSDTRAVMQATSVDRMILIADTNRYAIGVSDTSTGACNSKNTGPCCPRATCQSNLEVLEQVLGASTPLVSTKLYPTCCQNSNAASFVFPFDRIIGNFYGNMETLLLDSPSPSWATSEFHQAILGKLSIQAGGEFPTQEAVI